MQKQTATNLAQLFSLEGKVAAITGAGGVLFGAVARGLAGLGRESRALICAWEAQKTADDITANGAEAFAHAIDVLNLKASRLLVMPCWPSMVALTF